MNTGAMMGIVLLAALAAGALVLTIFLLWEEQQRKRRHWEGTIRELENRAVRDTGKTRTNILRHSAQEEKGWWGYIARQLPTHDRMEAVLYRANLKWGIGGLLGRTFLSFVLLGIVGILFGGLLVGFGSSLMGLWLPWLYASRRERRRMARFEMLFPETIMLLARAVRAGHPFSAGLQMVADEMPDPVGPEFRRVFEEQRFGLPLPESLVGMTDRLGIGDVKIFVTAVLIQRDVGGNLTEVLEQIAETIRERFRIKRAVQTFTAQGRMTGYLLAGMPVVVGGALFLIDPAYMRILFVEGVGRMLMAGGILLQVIGYLVIRKIVNVEY